MCSIDLKPGTDSLVEEPLMPHGDLGWRIKVCGSEMIMGGKGYVKLGEEKQGSTLL